MRPLTGEESAMAMQHHGLLVAFITQHHLDFCEYYGDLAETFCLAIAEYDESRGKLSTYVFTSLKNKMKNLYRAKTFEKVLPAELIDSLDQPISIRHGTATLAAVIPDCGTNVEALVMYRLGWEQICREFSSHELKVLHNIIYSTRTQHENAMLIGTSQTTYARWEKAVKAKAIRILCGR